MSPTRVDLARSIDSYAANPLFADAEPDEMFLADSPYRRPTRRFDNQYIDYTRPLTSSNQASNSALSTHRMLLNIYEAGMLFLPDAPGPTFKADFDNFYGHESLRRGELVRQALETKAYAFLDDEVTVSGTWTAPILVDYFRDFIEQTNGKLKADPRSSSLLGSILGSRDPARCAKHYLIQMASDFLSEASAMARLAPGRYGPVQSAIFNILIDEYGAGIHEHKHSTLFENTLGSVGLEASPHYYWQFYHATSLSLVNYFHYVTCNRQLFFRYIGALFYTEASLVGTTRLQSRMFREVFGTEIDTKYFDEHSHIDQHHGEMALTRVIEPMLARFGDAIAVEILRGFLEFQYLEEVADADLISQFAFFDKLPEYATGAKRFMEDARREGADIALETFVECHGERSTTHTHPDDRLLVIESGSMDFFPLFGESMPLGAGDMLAVPMHRMHGSVVTSPECVYHQPLVSLDRLERSGDRIPAEA